MSGLPYFHPAHRTSHRPAQEEDTMTTISSSSFSRRQFLAGAASLSALALAGCSSTSGPVAPPAPQFDPFYVNMYGPVNDGGHYIPAVDLNYVGEAFYR